MYPVRFEADTAAEGRNRLTVFFRWLTVIPVVIVNALYAIAAFFLAFIAWFAIVFTGKYPQGLYDFNSKFLRLSGRVNGYGYLLTDEYPPFNGNPDPSYPIVVDIDPPLESYDRVKTIFRIILAIPVYIVAYIWQVIAQLCAVIAWFAIMFTGKLPEGLATPISNGLRYYTQATAYDLLLLTETYPPFSGEGESEPAGQLPTSDARPKTEA